LQEQAAAAAAEASRLRQTLRDRDDEVAQLHASLAQVVAGARGRGHDHALRLQAADAERAEALRLREEAARREHEAAARADAAAREVREMAVFLSLSRPLSILI
jgi:hypothetical protein